MRDDRGGSGPRALLIFFLGDKNLGTQAISAEIKRGIANISDDASTVVMSGTPTVPFGDYLNNKGTGGSTTPLRDRDTVNPASASRFSIPTALNGHSTEQNRVTGQVDVASTSSFVGDAKISAKKTNGAGNSFLPPGF